jgi:hypothetical protein
LGISPPLRTETVVESLTRTLAPYIGSNMARSAVQSHRERLGIEGEAISAEQLEGLIAKVGHGLNVFLGRERAAGVVEEMRRSVAGSNGPQ